MREAGAPWVEAGASWVGGEMRATRVEVEGPRVETGVRASWEWVCGTWMGGVEGASWGGVGMGLRGVPWEEASWGAGMEGMSGMILSPFGFPEVHHSRA